MVVLGMSADMIFGGCIGAVVGGFLVGASITNKDPLPPCPGNVISAEYHKDGVMLCRYQQEPIGMKTYKQEMKK
jgi:hypothetical protein